MLCLYKYVRPLVFKIDPELAHSLTIKALGTGAMRPRSVIKSKALEQNIFGLTFPNPLGMAAGFDKNAEVITPVLRLGFGFTEIGTITPKPQEGNPKPRIFRDVTSGSVINRMGFPNKGLEMIRPNIEKFLNSPNHPEGIVGINIGMNKDQIEPAQDYCTLIRELAPIADYLSVNISSPNTAGLRDLQQKDILLDLLTKMMDMREKTCPKSPPALLVKLAPDLSRQQQEEIAETLLKAEIDGIILTNTTLDRPKFLPENFRSQKGGLSGSCVREKSTDLIRNFYKLTDGKLPIIGVGGISTAEHAYEKIKAGASLVQLYTGMIYEGPEIAAKINEGLLGLIKKDGFSSISQAIGAEFA